MNILTKKHLSRRTLLRGAGATLALPLLEAMIPAGTARAVSASGSPAAITSAAGAATPLARLACIYVPHGAVMNRWTPGPDRHGVRVLADPQAARALP